MSQGKTLMSWGEFLDSSQWSRVREHLAERLEASHNSLMVCDPDKVRAYQAEARVYKHLLSEDFIRGLKQ